MPQATRSPLIGKEIDLDDRSESPDFVEDISTNRLLCDILLELKKITFHLSMITDNDITNADVEV